MTRSAVRFASFRFRRGWLMLIALVVLIAGGAWVLHRFISVPDAVVMELPRDGTSEPVAHRVIGRHSVEDFGQAIVQFESVFWEPRDTESLREMIRETPLVRDKVVLEIGTGTGLIALCCLRAGARKVVATDVNPAAIANAHFNASALGVEERLETRLVPLDRASAYSVIGETERFDLIISNPPWEDRPPTKIAEYALYDEGFSLLASILTGLKGHLTPEGRAFLAYGCTDAIRQTQSLAPRHELKVLIRDNRSLEELPPVFLPGMLLEVRPEE